MPKARWVCPVCGREVADTKRSKQRHLRGNQHMRAALKQQLLRHGVKPVRWHDMIIRDARWYKTKP